MAMVYKMTGWSPPDFVVFGGQPAKGSAPVARRIHMRFAPGELPGTTDLHYTGEVALQARAPDNVCVSVCVCVSMCVPAPRMNWPPEQADGRASMR